MKLYNIDYIPGQNIEALGLVRGAVVQSKNFGKDFMAGMKTLVGGEIRSYTEMLNEARAIATKRMVDEAENLGADAHAGRRRDRRLRHGGQDRLIDRQENPRCIPHRGYFNVPHQLQDLAEAAQDARCGLR